MATDSALAQIRQADARRFGTVGGRHVPVAAAAISCCRVEHLSFPDAPMPVWVWGYCIEISNGLDRPLTILSRSWEIHPEGAAAQRTEALGINGEELVIEPGAARSYYSGVPLPTDKGGRMEGNYLARCGDGSIVRIPVRLQLDAGAPVISAEHEVHPERLLVRGQRYKKLVRAGQGAKLDLWPGKNDRPEELRKSLISGGGADFNTQKLSKPVADEPLETIILLAGLGDVAYTDRYIGGESFESLSVFLAYFRSSVPSLVDQFFDVLMVHGWREDQARKLAERFALETEQGGQPDVRAARRVVRAHDRTVAGKPPKAGLIDKLYEDFRQFAAEGFGTAPFETPEEAARASRFMSRFNTLKRGALGEQLRADDALVERARIVGNLLQAHYRAKRNARPG